MEIKVLSLFDGHSGGQLALRGLGISPTRYYASEIDPFAVEVTQTNFPRTVQLGDVVKLRRYLCPTPGKYTPGSSKRNPDPKLGYQIVSSTQIYKMLGNGWTIPVIEHILSFAPFAQNDN